MKNINKYIELTNIKPACNLKDVKALCNLAVQENVRSIVVNPEWVHSAKEHLSRLKREDIKGVQVYGFPTSRSTLLDGDEVDIFLKIRGCSKTENTKKMAAGMTGMALQRLKDQGIDLKNVKAVIETRVLTEGDVKVICKILCDNKIGVIKSSTGLYDRTNKRTNLEDLKLINKSCKIFGIIPRKYLFLYQPKIKMSGGIRLMKDAIELIKNGADYLGTSKIPTWSKDEKGQKSY